MNRHALPVAAEPRVAPLYRGFAETNGFCRLCGQGFVLTPTYGNPARCPECDVYMGGAGDKGRPANAEVAA